MVSIIIPSRNEQFLPNTVEELLTKARGDIEIIVILDGYWPDPILRDDPRVTLIHRSTPRGMRGGINSAAAIAKGEYLMKIDAHCMVDEGFDVKLVADCEDNWIVVPRRRRLDAENWCVQDVGKPDIDYNYLSFPDNPADFGGPGLNGRIWTKKALDRTDPKFDVDEELSFQGSCWFMPRAYFHHLELMDEENFGPFWNEAQELGFKSWLSGGKVMRNKKTWYAHLHKGNKYGRGFRMESSWASKGATYTKRWLYEDKVWHKQKYPLTWLIEKFMPMPTWPKDWKDQLKQVGGVKTDPVTYIKTKYRVETDGKQFVELPGKREELTKLLAELGLNKGVEVGVEQGKFSEVLCKRNPKIELFSVDAWTAYKGYREHVSQEKLDGFYEKTKKLLEPYNCTVIKGFSLDAVKAFKDGSLDFVYIDCNHDFLSTTQDIAAWEKKVRVGGIVAGHDFRRIKTTSSRSAVCHVKDVVQAWAYAHNIQPYFVFKDERAPSWFWVKR